MYRASLYPFCNSPLKKPSEFPLVRTNSPLRPLSVSPPTLGVFLGSGNGTSCTKLAFCSQRGPLRAERRLRGGPGSPRGALLGLAFAFSSPHPGCGPAVQGMLPANTALTLRSHLLPARREFLLHAIPKGCSNRCANCSQNGPSLPEDG